MWTYSLSNWELSDGKRIVHAYSGRRGPYQNNPFYCSAIMRGPIPLGEWTIGRAVEHTQLGPRAFPLVPCTGTETYGRSGFFIHGDSIEHPGDASDGCIVTCYPSGLADRQYIADNLALPNGNKLEVIP
ncbi:MAG: DUF2778 domain-containing protein [Patescibacteria group bacterium]|nr:DUF2778 domain-containing protein [Patescibacteria group bacterium]